MGLDMYLRGSRYLLSDATSKEISKNIHNMFPELGEPSASYNDGLYEVSTVVVNIGYWRKANHIHHWFVKYIQDGTDDCGDYTVTWHDLVQLRAMCQAVIDDPEKANDLLPTSSGFFFGGTDYDEWYFKDVQHTIDIINKIDAQLMTGQLDTGERWSRWEFEYQASW